MSTNGLEAVLEQFITSTRASFLELSQAHKETEQSIKQLNQTITRVEQQTEHDREAWNQRAEQLAQQAERDREAWQQRMAQYELEQKQDRKAWNKQWGETANRLGRVVEDIVAPNIPRIVAEQLGYTATLEDFSIRRKLSYPGQPDKQREFDTIAVYADVVILNETKETVRQSYLENFVAFVESGEFYGYFPQYQGRKLIPIFSSLYLAEPAVDYLTKHGIYALAMGDETMTLLNFEQLKGREIV